MLVDFPPFGIMNASNSRTAMTLTSPSCSARSGREGQDRAGHRPEPHPLPAEQPGRYARRLARHHRGTGQEVDFSQPYAGIAIGVFGARPTQISKPEDLSGKAIGVARASTQDTAVTDDRARKAHDPALRRRCQRVQALLSGPGRADRRLQRRRRPDREDAPRARFEQKFSCSQQVRASPSVRARPNCWRRVNAFLAKIKADGELNKSTRNGSVLRCRISWRRQEVRSKRSSSHD